MRRGKPSTMSLKPDRLNGAAILRGVERKADGVAVMSPLIVFPPRLRVKPQPILDAERLAAMALNSIIICAHDAADHAAQSGLFRRDLKRVLTLWMRRAAAIERERCRRRLRAHGLEAAADAIGEGDG